MSQEFKTLRIQIPLSDQNWRVAAETLLLAYASAVPALSGFADPNLRPMLRLLQRAIPRDPDEVVLPFPPPVMRRGDDDDTAEFENPWACGPSRSRQAWDRMILQDTDLGPELRDQVIAAAITASNGGAAVVLPVRELTVVMTSLPDLDSPQRRTESVELHSGSGAKQQQLSICFSSTEHFFEYGKEIVVLEVHCSTSPAENASIQPLLDLLLSGEVKSDQFQSTVCGAKVEVSITR